MSDDTLKYPRGTCLMFTSGEYSGFGLRGVLVTIVDCDLPVLAQEFARAEQARALAGKMENRWRNDLDIEDFPSWLVANGHAMPANVQTVHLGDYDKFEPEFGVSDEMHELPEAVIKREKTKK